MKKLLISSTNNSRATLWKPLVKELGGENIYVCCDGAELAEELIIQGIPRSNIFSTEAPFYSISHELITGRISKNAMTAKLTLEELEIINNHFGVFAHQACRLIIGNASTHQLHTIYIQTINYWKNLLRYYDITNIFFSQVAHTGGDYCLYVASKLMKGARIKAGHPICRSKIFIETESPNHNNEESTGNYNINKSNKSLKEEYLANVLEETVAQGYAARDKNSAIQETANEPEYIEGAKRIINGKINNLNLTKNKYLTEKIRPNGKYFCVFMGSEPEASNNPNSVPVLTAIQALSLLSAYLKENDLLVLREHPHMLNGTKQFAWEKKDSFDHSRSSMFFSLIESRKNTYYALPNIAIEEEFKNCLGIIAMGGDVGYEALTNGIRFLDLSSFRKKAMKGLEGYYTIDEIDMFINESRSIPGSRVEPSTISNHIEGKTYFNTFINRPAIEKGPSIQV